MTLAQKHTQAMYNTFHNDCQRTVEQHVVGCLVIGKDARGDQSPAELLHPGRERLGLEVVRGLAYGSQRGTHTHTHTHIYIYIYIDTHKTRPGYIASPSSHQTHARTSVALQPPAPHADPARVALRDGVGDAHNGRLELRRHELRHVEDAGGRAGEGVLYVFDIEREGGRVCVRVYRSVTYTYSTAAQRRSVYICL